MHHPTGLLNRLTSCALSRFVTFEDDSAVERVFGAGRMHTIGGKSVEVKPATPRGSGPTGLAMGRGFAMVLPGRGMARGGFAEMAPATAAAYPGGPYQGYAGMVPYASGGRLQPMVRIRISSAVPGRVLCGLGKPFQRGVWHAQCVPFARHLLPGSLWGAAILIRVLVSTCSKLDQA